MKRLIVLIGIMLFVLGCASKQKQGAINGALLGATTGAAVSSPTGVGIAVGAPVGAVLGLCLGDYIDKQTNPTLYSTCEAGDSCVEPLSVFKMNEEEDLYYMVYEKDGKFYIAKKSLKATKWEKVN